MSSDSDLAGRLPSGRKNRRRLNARRRSPGRLFRPSGLDRSPISSSLQWLEDRTLLSIGNPGVIGSLSESITDTTITEVDVPVTVSAAAGGLQGETVIVTVALDTPLATGLVSVTDSTTGATYHLDGKANSPTGKAELLIFSEYLTSSLIGPGANQTKIQVTFPATTTDVSVTAVDAVGLLVVNSTTSSGVSTGGLTGTSDMSGNPTSTSVTTSSAVTSGSTGTADELAIGGIAVADNTMVTGDSHYTTLAGPASTTGLSALTQYEQLSNVSGSVKAGGSFSDSSTDWASAVVTYAAPASVDVGQPHSDPTPTGPYQPIVPSVLPTRAGVPTAPIAITPDPRDTGYVTQIDVTALSGGTLSFTLDAVDHRSGTITAATLQASNNLFTLSLTEAQTLVFTSDPSLNTAALVRAGVYSFTVEAAADLGTVFGAPITVPAPPATSISVIPPYVPVLGGPVATTENAPTGTIAIAADSRDTNTNPALDYVTQIDVTALGQGALSFTPDSGDSRAGTITAASLPFLVSLTEARTLVFTPTATYDLNGADSSEKGTYSFTVEAAAATGGGTVVSDPVVVPITVTPAADLKLSIQQPPAMLQSGQTFSYFITMTNAGPSTAHGITLSDPLPTGLQADGTATLATAYSSPNFSFIGNVYTFSLGPNSSATLMIPVKVMTMAAGGTVQDVATITGIADATDIDASNSASVVSQVASSLTVMNNSDDPMLFGSLPFVIGQANATLATTQDVVSINFAPSVSTIPLTSPLPTITRPVAIIGGRIAQGLAVNIQEGSVYSGGPLLTLGAGSSAGLNVSTIQTIAFTTAANTAIEISGGTGDQVLGDIISGNSTGTSGPIPNATGDGVLVDGSASGAILNNDQISGAAVGIVFAGASGNLVQGDVIGSTNPITRAGNGTGIRISGGSIDNVIGIDAGTSQNAYSQAQVLGDTIANNTLAGIADDSAGPNTIRGNAIYQNGPAIINVDPNSPLIPHGIVRPVASSTPTVNLTGAVLISGATTPLTIEGSLGGSTSTQTYRIDFYTQAVQDPTQADGTPTPNGELTPAPQGRVYLGSFDFTPSLSVNFSYTNLPTSLLSLVQAGQFITATATPVPPSTSPTPVEDTSPFSGPVFVSSGLEVINNNASGPGSFFGALQVAASLGANATNSIVFRLPAGESTIVLSDANPLPAIVNNLLIDGYTQAGAAQATDSIAATFVATIDGSGLSSGSGAGLTIGVGGSATIRGLRFINFKANVPAILVMGGADSHISGDVFGYQDDSSIPLNSGDGVKVDASTNAVSSLTIGGTNVADRNLFAGNATGIEVVGPKTGKLTIEGNNFGLEGDNSTTASNGTGILIDGAPDVSVLDNTIVACSAYAIRVEGNVSPLVLGGATSIVITGNTIGIVGHGNGEGIFLDGATSRVPIVIQGNVIVASSGTGTDEGNGVELKNSANVLITSNFIGLDFTGSAGTNGGFANAGDGLLIADSTTVSVTLDVIANNGGNGVEVISSTSTITSSAITFQSNSIGIYVDPTSNTSTGLGNGLDGLLAHGATSTSSVQGLTLVNNFIDVRGRGGALGRYGIELSNASNARISGGSIVGTLKDGITLVGGSGNAIGGVSIGGADVISADGISIVGASGTTLSGVVISGVGIDGIAVSGGSLSTQINGVTIASSGEYGISVTGSTNTTISVPSITGSLGDGIAIESGSSGTKLIGGTIGGSAFDGIAVLGGTNATLSGASILNSGANGIRIDLDASGTQVLGDLVSVSGVTGAGIRVLGGSTTVNGSTVTGAAADGIDVLGAMNATVSGSTIQSSGRAGLVIDVESANALISGGTILDSHGDGLVVGTATDSTITGVVLSRSGGDGINIKTGAERTQILNDTVSIAGTVGGTSGDGIGINGGFETLVNNSTVSQAAGDGILIRNVTASTVSGTTITGSGSAGIAVSDASGIVLTNNSISGGGTGILLMGEAGTTLTGNTISGASADGLSVISSTTTNITGSRISGSGGNGITLSGDTTTQITGGMVAGSKGDGVSIVGGSGTSLLSVAISGSGGNGITVGGGARGTQLDLDVITTTLRGAGILIVGGASGQPNTSGTSISAGSITGAKADGVAVLGGAATTVSAVTIGQSGGDGVDVNGVQGTQILGNVISGSGLDGILVVNAPGTTIGGMAGPNVITGGAGQGVEVTGTGSTSIMIQGNFIGTVASGQTSGGNLGDGVYVHDLALSTAAPEVTIQGNVIANSKGLGVVLIDLGNAKVLANEIGSDGTGTKNLGNNGDALYLDRVSVASVTGNVLSFSATANGLEATGAGATSLSIVGNTIGSNGFDGILVTGNPGLALLVQGNFIGTDSANRSGLGNASEGVALVSTSSAMIASNVIAGNARIGLVVGNSNVLTISNNDIGAGNDAGSLDGAVPLGNGLGGAMIVDPNGATIAGNTISNNGPQAGSGGFGLLIARTNPSTDGTLASNVAISNNLIGTNTAGKLARGNKGFGVVLDHVSGTFSGNIISANLGDGLLIAHAVAPSIGGNTFGSGTTGTESLGNALDGIRLMNTASAAIAGNIVAFNNLSGVEIDGDPASGRSLAYVGYNWIGTNHSLSAGLGNGAGGNGSAAGVLINGATGVLVLDNHIDSNTGAGIIDNGSGLTISSNFIGTAPNLATNLGNLGHGVSVAGGSGVTIVGNTIGENSRDGVFAANLSGLTILGNFIGTDAIGTATVLGNQADGIDLQQVNNSTVQGNTVVNQGRYGIEVDGVSGQLGLIGNVVGVLIGGKAAGNKNDGIYIDATPDLSIAPVSVTVSGNSVAFNGVDGVHLAGSTGVLVGPNNRIAQNGANGVEIGPDASNRPAVSNAVTGAVIEHNNGDGVLIGQSSGNLVDSSLIDGNQQDGVAIVQSSTGNTVTYNRIDTNQGDGVHIKQSTGNRIGSSFIGFDPSQADPGNVGDGVAIEGVAGVDASDNTITADVIAGNHNSGVLISGQGASGNTLSGNEIGSAGLANRNDGVTILQAGGGNVLSSNAIELNANNGVLISTTRPGTVLSGNFIGTDAAGTVGLGNKNYGVFINDTSGSVVQVGNEIWENHSHGVVISGGSGNIVVGSSILGNQLDGVLLLNTTGNLIGIAGSGNVIALNGTDGVGIFNGGGNAVQSNLVGIDSNSSASGNKGDGVHIVGSNGNTIGGPVIGQGNTIAANQQSGVEVFGNSSANAILGNVLGATVAHPGLGNKLDGVLIAGSTASDANGQTDPTSNFIGSSPDGSIAANFILDNQSNGVAIDLASSNFVRSNVIQGNQLDGVNVAYSTGIAIDSGNAILGNLSDGIGLIGSTATSIANNAIQGNSAEGIDLVGSTATTIQGNTIGGPSAAEDNGSNGIGLNGSNGTMILFNTVLGNLGDGVDVLGSVTTTLDGNVVEANKEDGVRVEQNSAFNNVGLAGTAPNVIIENAAAGIEVSTGSIYNSLQNNLVGYLGSATAQGNAIGVYLNQVDGNVVGGASLDVGANTITGNSVAGVYVSGNTPGSAAPAGNQVQYNFIGTDPLGNNPTSFPASLNDVGVYVLNSRRDGFTGNVISGNHQAGIELFGIGSTGDAVIANTIGSNRAMTAPIVTNPVLGLDVYSTSNPATGYVGTRQNFGVWIDGAGGSPNTIAYNHILGNEVGVEVDGSTATNNLIALNAIGPAPGTYAEGSPNVGGLGNFYGIYVNNTQGNQIIGNQVDRNLSVGVAIVGASADSNSVQGNFVGSNGGYGLQSPDGQSVTEVAITPGARVFGSGIYIEGGQGNVVAKNTIRDSAQVGVYIFNFGALTSAPNNSVTGNVIVGVNHPKGPWNGDYGVLLFDSSGNIPGVPQVGKSMNRISGNRIANFREYTGPGAPEPATVPTNGSAPVATSPVRKVNRR